MLARAAAVSSRVIRTLCRRGSCRRRRVRGHRAATTSPARTAATAIAWRAAASKVHARRALRQSHRLLQGQRRLDAHRRRESRQLGATGIVAGNIPVATGAALACKLNGKGQVVLCFFGDGASNNGTFHESLNMAGVWKLPVIYVCENNLYGMSVSTARACAVQDISVRASS